jgi:deoxyuridine 5'-triphosphate nucleotidohydrolase
MKVKRLTETAKLPTRAYPDDLGYDIYADESVTIPPGQHRFISTGLVIQLDAGYGCKLFDRGSMARNGVTVIGGVFDGGYLGEYLVCLHNINPNATVYIGKGQKIVQMVLLAIVDVDIEETTEPFLQTVRGEKRFGSSGS